MVDDNLFALRMAELEASIALLSLSEQYRRLGMDEKAREAEAFGQAICAQGQHRSLVLPPGPAAADDEAGGE